MLTPKKSLGQNFLQDQNVVRKIAESIDPKPGEILLEIGPGTGSLTAELVKSRARLVAVELDPRAVEVLRRDFGAALELVQADIRQTTLNSIIPGSSRVRVAGNIPYYITSEILFWVFDQHERVSDATMMMQLEVAERLTAKPRTKEYGILSVFTEYYSVPKILFRVSRNSFFPRPNVDSAVVRLTLKSDPVPCDVRLFRNVVRSTFGQRRKTLRNGLRSMGCSDDQLKNLSFDLTRRPEELTSADFLELVRQLAPSAPVLPLRFT